MRRNYKELARAFESGDINVAGFGHIDHVGVAYQMLGDNDFLDASVKYSRSINTIATKAGHAQKFNVTITMAFLSLIAERMSVTHHNSFDTFIAKNEDLLSADLLSKWYSLERLRSDLARAVFLLPDADIESSART